MLGIRRMTHRKNDLIGGGFFFIILASSCPNRIVGIQRQVSVAVPGQRQVSVAVPGQRLQNTRHLIDNLVTAINAEHVQKKGKIIL